jgi:hypothetical protein
MRTKTTAKLSTPLYQRARRAADGSGYSSVEEFIEHAVEKELMIFESAETKDDVMKKLKGLGYID